VPCLVHWRLYIIYLFIFIIFIISLFYYYYYYLFFFLFFNYCLFNSLNVLNSLHFLKFFYFFYFFYLFHSFNSFYLFYLFYLFHSYLNTQIYNALVFYSFFCIFVFYLFLDFKCTSVARHSPSWPHGVVKGEVRGTCSETLRRGRKGFQALSEQTMADLREGSEEEVRGEERGKDAEKTKGAGDGQATEGIKQERR